MEEVITKSELARLWGFQELLDSVSLGLDNWLWFLGLKPHNAPSTTLPSAAAARWGLNYESGESHMMSILPVCEGRRSCDTEGPLPCFCP